MRLTDDTLFHCPFIMMTEVGQHLPRRGGGGTNLRTYLLKGGFLWADDFWGSSRGNVWEEQIRKVFPPSEYPIVDLPLESPALPVAVRDEGRSAADFSDRRLGSDGGARRNAARTAPRCTSARSSTTTSRIMVLITHNTDFGDSYEREGDNPEYFYQMSVPGYAFGINTLLYAMTH